MIFTYDGKQPEIKAVIGSGLEDHLLAAVGHVNDEGMYNFEKFHHLLAS